MFQERGDEGAQNALPRREGAGSGRPLLVVGLKAVRGPRCGWVCWYQRELIHAQLRLFSQSGRRCDHTRACVSGSAGHTSKETNSLRVGEAERLRIQRLGGVPGLVRRVAAGLRRPSTARGSPAWIELSGCGRGGGAGPGVTRAAVLPEKRVGGMLDGGIYPRRSGEG